MTFGGRETFTIWTRKRLHNKKVNKIFGDRYELSRLLGVVTKMDLIVDFIKDRYHIQNTTIWNRVKKKRLFLKLWNSD